MSYQLIVNSCKSIVENPARFCASYCPLTTNYYSLQPEAVYA